MRLEISVRRAQTDLINTRNETNVLSVRDASVQQVQKGSRGRPRKVIDESLLREAFKATRKITLSQLARSLGVHRHTVRASMKACGIRLPSQRLRLNEQDTDTLVGQFRSQRPDSGGAYLAGNLLSQGVAIPRSRIRESQKRVDPVGLHIRTQTTIQHRAYKVKRPNALWHQDGYHKLIQYGFVIHGIVDGYSRLVSSFSHLPKAM